MKTLLKIFGITAVAILGVILALAVFIGAISIELNWEDAIRQQKAANGECFWGKDTVIIWGKIFEIGHLYDGNHLFIQYTPHLTETILMRVTKHKTVGNRLFVVSEEGYAVIDRDGLCRALITVSEEEYSRGYTVNDDGSKHYSTRYLENEHMQYLTEFSQYAPWEQEIFNKMMKK